MSTTRNNGSTFRFTGWHMLVCMLAFFGVIIVVNVTMATLASGTWTGLVVKNSYIASQKFNGELEQARHQVESGLSSHVAVSDGAVSFGITDRNGAAMKPQEAVLWIGRPAFEQQDRNLRAACDGQGECTARADLAPGSWALRIEATLPDGLYRRDARLFVGADGKVQVE